MKLSILASAAALAIASGPTHAQTVPSPAAAASAPPGAAKDEPGAQDGSATGQRTREPAKATSLPVVTVTAQRIRESSQKAPIPIAVVKPEELTLQGITRAEDLSRVVPALVAGSSGGPNTSFFIRGVGNVTVNSYSDPAISFNYDGVYLGRPSATQGFLYDLDRVEVLKGPQGTLYGRNATAGAINVLPRRPDLKQDGGEIEAGFGNYGALSVQGAVNRRLGENTALRLSATVNKRDGYLSDGTSDQDQRAVRAQLLTKLTPQLETRFGADYAHQGGFGKGSSVFATYAFVNPTEGYVATPVPQLGEGVGVHDPRTDAFLQTRFLSQAGRLSEAQGTKPRQDNAVWGLMNETNWTTDAGTLTVQAAYRESKIDSLQTTSNFRGYSINEKSKQTTLEARFAGKLGDRADYLLGGFYFDENIDNKAVINQLIVTPFQTYTTGTESKAIFGRLRFRPTDELTLTTGVRYTADKKFMKGVSDIYTLFCGAPTPPQDNCPTVPLMPLVSNAADLVAFYAARGIAFGPPGSRGPNTPTILNTQIPTDSTLPTKKTTYRFAADFQATPSNMLYVSYETGFHAGGFNFARGLETFAPEFIDAMTLGSKNRFLGDSLQVNVELFQWKYKNQQVSQFGSDLGNPPLPVFYTSNISRSTIKGVDLDFEARVTPTTRLSGGLQYLNTSYDSYTFFAPNTFPPLFACPYTTSTFRGAPAYAVDCSGKPSGFSPKWSFNLGVQQSVEVGDMNVIGRASTRYRGDFYALSNFQPWAISKAGFESSASLTLEPNSANWWVTAYVNNIENRQRLSEISFNPNLQTVGAITSAPRTFGLRVGMSF